MPKTFSESERAYIKGRLMDEARSCLMQYGIRKTTVDELVKRVNIPKGTFYLFYESKERLLFDVVLQLNDDIQSDLLKEISGLQDAPDAGMLTDIIFRIYKRMDDSFLPRLIVSGEMEYFMRTLKPELSKMHAEHDDLSIQRLLEMLPGMKERRAQLYSAALRSIFLSLMYKKEIGEDIFDETLHILIRGVVLQLLESDGEEEM